MSSDRESKGNQEDKGIEESGKSKGTKHPLWDKDFSPNKRLKTTENESSNVNDHPININSPTSEELVFLSQSNASETSTTTQTNIDKPLEQWTKEEVKTWFEENEFSEYYEPFEKLSGKHLSLLSENNFISEFGPILGGAIYNSIQKLKAPAEFIGGSSPEKLHESIVNHAWKSCILKEKFEEPRTLSYNHGKFVRKGRDKQIEMVYDCLSTRYSLRNCKINSQDRANNPLAAIHSAPGGGKSFFLDELAKLKPEDLNKLCKDEEMRKILQHSTIAVTVTYNSGTTFTDYIDKEYPTAGLALRVLFSYYFSDESNWWEFSKSAKNIAKSLTLEDALNCITYASKQSLGVFLLVDELIKCNESNEKNSNDLTNVDKVLSEIGGCLNLFPSERFNCIVSTLDTRPIMKTQSKSGRPICWILLEPLSIVEAMELFEKYKHLLSLCQCISDCNGHPRSLEALKIVCEKFNWDLPNYYTMITKLVDQVRNSLLLIPDLALIKAALRGVPVNLSDSPDEDKMVSYRDYIMMGYYLNTINPDSKELIPRLSPLLLAIFAWKFLNDKENVRYNVALCIRNMLQLESHFGWEQFEHFHLYWERLRRLMYQGEQVTIGSYYRLESSENTSDQPFVLEPKTIYELVHHFPSVTKENPMGDAVVKNGRFITKLDKGIFKPAANNPGFDIVVFEAGKAIAIECRFSNPEASTVFPLEDALRKRQLTEKAFEPHIEGGELFGKSTVGKLGLKADDIVLVICAFRELTNDFADDNIVTKLPKNTIVLGKHDLQSIYSPTLASRPQFLSSLVKEAIGNIDYQ